MSYVDKILLPGEQVLGVAVLHWIMYVKGLAITIFGGLLGCCSPLILNFLFGNYVSGEFARALTLGSAVIVFIGTMLLIGAYLRQTNTEIVMTNHRLIAKYGIFSRMTFEIMANRISGANFDQTVGGRLLDYGTIWVHGAGGDMSPIYQVSDPQAFYRAVIGVLENPRAAARAPQ